MDPDFRDDGRSNSGKRGDCGKRGFLRSFRVPGQGRRRRLLAGRGQNARAGVFDALNMVRYILDECGQIFLKSGDIAGDTRKLSIGAEPR